MPSSLHLLLFFLLLSLPAHLLQAAFIKHCSPSDTVRSSCIHARYPKLCSHSLASYSGPPTAKGIARAAVGVSLSRAQSVSGYLQTEVSTLAHKTSREKAALSDCAEQISDSVDELKQTLGELRGLKRGGDKAGFRWHVSNAETWVSAALTNEDTCLDGFQGVDGQVKAAVRRKITHVARLTSNALSLITRLDN